MTGPATPTPAAPAPTRESLTVGPLDAVATAAWQRWQTDAAWIDRADRRRLMFTGAKAADVLGGLVTNDVVALTVGGGHYAAALTPKGKVIADLRVVRLADDRLLVETDGRAGDGFVAMIRKYVNPRLAAYRDISSATRAIGVYGPTAARVIEAVLATRGLTPWAPLDAMAAHAVQAWPVGDDWWLLVRSADFGGIGFDLVVPATDADAVIGALSAVPQLSVEAAECARIAAGRPRWGIDMDESTIPQEARLEALGAISFEKGCYTGQEVVARLHFRGHVNKRLVQLRATRSAPLLSGAPVTTADGAVVGDVRSSAVVPGGEAVAIAMVRREVEDGAVVRVGEVEATVQDRHPEGGA